MSSAPPIDLSAIPEDQRDAVLAVLRERDALREANKRLEHLVAELNQAVHGKRSEKLSEDERQLAFEDLETAVAEVETQQDAQAATGPAPRPSTSLPFPKTSVTLFWQCCASGMRFGRPTNAWSISSP
ncbi:transposase, partial [Leisingera sp.]|uniref:transposase n=1 Tax=Leisingera sp. TaxID=1879318 RepID=UPI002B2700AE